MNIRKMAIVAVLLTVFTLGISYASLSVILNINGTAQVRAANWDVHFENLSAPLTEGLVLVNVEPTLISNSTSFSDLNVTFNRTNSSITYNVDLVNDGDIDAQVNNVTSTTPLCNTTSVVAVPSNAEQDKQDVCNAISHSVKYTADGSDVAIGDDLLAGESKEVAIKINYAGTNLPLNVISINNLETAIGFSQKP